MEDYLIETPSIDYVNFHIQERVQELKNQSDDNLDYIKRSYIFVRLKTSNDVLKNKTGICWTKSLLLAALLRADV